MTDKSKGNGLPNEFIRGGCLTWLRAASSDQVDAVITDPPYGIAYKTKWESRGKPRGAAGHMTHGGAMAIANDERPFIWFLHDAYRVTRDPGCLICFCRWDVQEVFRVAIECAGWKVRAQLIWDRVIHGTGDLASTPGPRHDVAWYATKGLYKFHGDRPLSVIPATRDHADAIVHPNQKPLKLMLDLVGKYVPEGGTVLDPFAGSGATLQAAKLLGRGYIGIELDEAHHALATRRLGETAGLFSANVA